MRVILDANHITDLKKCLEIYLANYANMEEGDEWGYWSQRDEEFSAYIRCNKASVSVRGRRKDAP